VKGNLRLISKPRIAQRRERKGGGTAAGNPPTYPSRANQVAQQVFRDCP
jgi:hypothetical protein